MPPFTNNIFHIFFLIAISISVGFVFPALYSIFVLIYIYHHIIASVICLIYDT
ncbi:hypothetical protein MMC18_004765 [Xylographa bjoerkii]|nr:hypothetical protein [Xylographa bjoerkii]